MKDLDANLIIANAPDPVFVSDLQGKILVANEAISELLGFRKDEVLEQSLSRFISSGARLSRRLAIVCGPRHAIPNSATLLIVVA